MPNVLRYANDTWYRRLLRRCAMPDDVGPPSSPKLPQLPKLWVGIPLLLIVGMIVFSIWWYFWPATTGYRYLRPNKVVYVVSPKSPGGPNVLHLRGSFDVKRSFALEKDTLSYGTGGGCIIGDLAKVRPELEKSCNVQSDCGEPHPGYCVNQRCWYQPDPPICDRQPDEVWDLGTHELYGQLPLSILNGHNPAEVRWKVATCGQHVYTGGPPPLGHGPDFHSCQGEGPPPMFTVGD
jgi:hypothetical protein